MKFKPNKAVLLKAYLGVFILCAFILFLICFNLFIFTEWNYVQPIIIVAFLFVSALFLILTFNSYSYEVDKNSFIVYRGKKVMKYYFSEIIYFDYEKSQKKKTLTFVTDKGHVRYYPLDQEGKLLDIINNECAHTISLDELQRRYPNIRL